MQTSEKSIFFLQNMTKEAMNEEVEQ